ncbi:MAG TPA: tetratricopeptide repeat protein [Streptosporangiaceae bacterium]|nr:tetratricopeptide repeat protein [Streptosporangiaceae bacterium]
MAICRETDEWLGEGSALNNLGMAYCQLWWLEEAIGCFQESLAIWRETGDRDGEGTALGNLGGAYQQLRR